MTSKNLLVELFVEELPPKALNKLGEAFAAALTDSLKAQGLSTAASITTAYASPRRLAAHISFVSDKAEDKAVSQKLMPVSVGIDLSGLKTPALVKRLQALGVEPSAQDRMVLALSNTPAQQIRSALEAAPQQVLRRALDGKAEALFFDSLVAGVNLQAGLQKALHHALANLPIPKLMQYQLADGWSSVNFVRPAHGLVALHGADVVAVEALGLTSGRITHGHRFEASTPSISLRHADSYAEQLRVDGAVIASFAERRAEIAKQLISRAPEGLVPIEDSALLGEVTALVERPNVLLCQFEAEFLDVPQECLILTMKANQKYFPLLDAGGKLTNQFLIVSNITPADPSRVIEGNERVVRPRLADAKFFFDQDRKKTLESRVTGLDKVVYHGKLGTQGERVARVRDIAGAIGKAMAGQVLETQANQAAALAKADLLTDMVGEFPELQGVMGRYYAKHDGLSDEVAFAIEDHYKPRFAGDDLPSNEVGLAVALADKLETLVGMFGIGQFPSGDKDPFALRRHALGVIRILVEKKLSLDLQWLLKTASGAFASVDDDLLSTADHAFEHTAPTSRKLLTEFIFDRLAGNLRDQGYSAQEVDAVLSLKPDRLVDVTDRLAAVRAFAALPEAAALAAANKRVGNILKKVEGALPTQVDANLLKEAAETNLLNALNEVQPKADAAFNQGQFTDSLKALAALREPVDAFFESVMVNAEDAALRNNRLALLSRLHIAMNRVADLAKLAT
jgi:glycyl-tRNA synthetase beta chain